MEGAKILGSDSAGDILFSLNKRLVCVVPCPDYCPPAFPDIQLPPIPAFYTGGAPPTPPSYGFYSCSPSGGECPGRSVGQTWDFVYVCDGSSHWFVLHLCADLECDDIVADHPDSPGCGRSCRLVDPVVWFEGDTGGPCFDPSLITFMYCV